MKQLLSLTAYGIVQITLHKVHNSHKLTLTRTRTHLHMRTLSLLNAKHISLLQLAYITYTSLLLQLHYYTNTLDAARERERLEIIYLLALICKIEQS